jgi:hypothetical protein
MTIERHEPRSPQLRKMFWRDEILQVMFWIEGEGLGDEVDAATLARFLGVDAGIATTYLDRLVDEDYLQRDDQRRYRLSAQGRADGSRIFAAEFADLTQPGHGECGADCWCHASIEEAEACNDERRQAAGLA